MQHPGFLWGAATSAHQVEGHNEASDWWNWEQNGHVEGGAISGAACDHWTHVEADLKLAAGLGLNSYRFSVEWAKLEPRQGEWNEQALSWYVNLIDHCEQLNLLPMLTLHHFTLPLWVAEKGGFSNDENINHFVKFVEKVVDRLGPRVPLWCTFNEPMVLLTGCYIGRFMPPALYAPKLFAKACENILRAHVLSYDLIHTRIEKRSGPWKDQPLEVGIANNMLDFLPDRWWHPLEQGLARTIRRFYNRSWLNALSGKRQHFGIPFILPSTQQVPEARNRVTMDFIGVNYYTKAYVKWRPRDSSSETLAQVPLGISFARRLDKQTDMGWAVHPAGFRSVLLEAAKYGLPIYVTENGLADRDDRLRSEYVISHLKEVSEAQRLGAQVKGYFYWSLFDNFEWIKGFGPRFGLFHVDYQTQKRTARPSCLLYKSIIHAHQEALPPSKEILENF